MLTRTVFPAIRRLIEIGYFSLEVEGAEHVPRSGPAVYVGNHAGWFTLDTLIGAVAIADHIGPERLPWGAVHDRLLQTGRIGRFFEGVGGFPASWLRTPSRIPEEMEVFSIYPEGVAGNCKSFLQAYQMRPWRTGFVRIAAARGAPIVPVAILGGEECLPVAAPVHALEPIFGSVMPLPLIPVPLPARWRFIFHPPVQVSERDLRAAEGNPDREKVLVRELADDVARIVQRTLDRETTNSPLVRLTKFVGQHASSLATMRGALSVPLGSSRAA